MFSGVEGYASSSTVQPQFAPMAPRLHQRFFVGEGPRVKTESFGLPGTRVWGLGVSGFRASGLGFRV